MGGTPILSDIVDGLKSMFDWFLGIAPRPVLYLLFLWGLVFIGTFIMPFFFNMTGNFCIEEERFTNAAYDLPTNLNAYFDQQNIAGAESNLTGTLLVESECVQNLNVTGTLTRYYKGDLCTSCETVDDYADAAYARDPVTNADNLGLCAGDAHPLPSENLTWYEEWQCETLFDPGLLSFSCIPPLGYYYDFTIGAYVCEETALCGNATEMTYFAETLIERGFTRFPTDSSSEPPVAGVKCVDSKPKLAFVGVDVLDYRLWLLLTFIGLIWWIWTVT